MNTERVAFYGGHFDPPGLHHINIVTKILQSKLADKVIVVPSGFDAKKAFAPVEKRRRLIELSFSNIENVFIDFINLDKNIYLKYAQYEEMFGHMGKIIYVLGADHFHGGKNSLFLTRGWSDNKFIFENGEFIVVKRKGYNEEKFLPPNAVLLETDGLGSSSEIRSKIKNGESIDDLVTPEVSDYIRENSLYL